MESSETAQNSKAESCREGREQRDTDNSEGSEAVEASARFPTEAKRALSLRVHHLKNFPRTFEVGESRGTSKAIEFGEDVGQKCEAAEMAEANAGLSR